MLDKISAVYFTQIRKIREMFDPFSPSNIGSYCFLMKMENSIPFINMFSKP